MAGDLLNGRTVRSLCYLMGKFKQIQISFVAPMQLAMKQDVMDYLFRHNVQTYECDDIRKVSPLADVIYQTRVQKECGSEAVYSSKFVVDRELMGMLKPGAIVMHPLPRVDEITQDADIFPSAVYLTDQIDSGLYTRMALLKMILAPKD